MNRDDIIRMAPEPRVHAAFSELLCALNPKLRETKECMDRA